MIVEMKKEQEEIEGRRETLLKLHEITCQVEYNYQLLELDYWCFNPGILGFTPEMSQTTVKFVILPFLFISLIQISENDKKLAILNATKHYIALFYYEIIYIDLAMIGKYYQFFLSIIDKA